jgi:hypothetical protein
LKVFPNRDNAIGQAFLMLLKATLQMAFVIVYRMVASVPKFQGYTGNHILIAAVSFPETKKSQRDRSDE